MRMSIPFMPACVMKYNQTWCVAERGNDSGEFRLGWEMRGEGVPQVCRLSDALKREREKGMTHIPIASTTFAESMESRDSRHSLFPSSSLCFCHLA